MSICKTIACGLQTHHGLDFCRDCTQEHQQAVLIFTAPHTGFPGLPTNKMESDPSGKSLNTSGAKADAGKIRMHLVTGGMARAIREVAKVATYGANKYTDGGWVEVPNGFNRYEDAQQRHATDRHVGMEFDPETQLSHLAHEAWNSLAKLDLYLRAKETNDTH